MAFLPAYLRGLGLSGREISTVFTVPPLLALVVPLGWAWLADRTRRHERVLRVVRRRRLARVHCRCCSRAAFRRSSLAAAARLRAVRGRGGRAGRRAGGRPRAGRRDLRAPAALGLGRLRGRGRRGRRRCCRRAARARRIDLVPIAMWLALGCAVRRGARPARRRRGRRAPARRRRARRCSRDPRLRLLLAVAALHWICLAPYNVYFGVFLRDLGLAAAGWGLAYSTGVVAEVLVLHDVPPAAGPLPAGHACWRWRSRSARCAGWRSPPSALPGAADRAAGAARHDVRDVLERGDRARSPPPSPRRCAPPARRCWSCRSTWAARSATRSPAGSTTRAARALLFLLAAIGELAPLAVVLAARRRLRDCTRG